MDKVLENYNLFKLTQGRISEVTYKKNLILDIINFFKVKMTGLDGFTGEFCQTFKNNYNKIQYFKKSLRKERRGKDCLSSSRRLT